MHKKCLKIYLEINNMTGTIILLIVIIAIGILGRYAVAESQRLERQKRFMKDMENFNKRNKQ